MITINLLPQREINQVKMARLRASILKRASALTLFGILLVSALGATDFILRRELRRVNEQLETKMQEVDTVQFLKIKEEIKKFNENLERVERVQSRQIRLSPFLVELVKITPRNVSFASLDIFGAEKKVQLRGVARTRDDLLEFQQNLDKSDLFQEVESPLSNLTSRENVEFQLKFKIKSE